MSYPKMCIQYIWVKVNDSAFLTYAPCGPDTGRPDHRP